MAEKKENRDKRKAKLEEKLSEIRQKGAALETAIQNNKKRERNKKLILKWKNRKFATPTTTEEAQVELPPLSKQLGIGMSKQDIIEKGTLLQKARLYYTLLDFDNYFGSSEDSPDEIRASLVASITSKKDLEFLQRCAKEFVSLQQYGQRLSYYFKRFQTSFAILARLLNLLDGYEREAENLSKVYKEIKFFETEELAKELASKMANIAGQSFEGATLRLEADRESPIFVDADITEGDKKSLYSKIQEEAASTTESLSDFKAYAMVVEQFLNNDMDIESTLRYMPISIQMSIENAEEERFTRYLVKNLSFFRSEMNYRRSNGETITPEEERRAVIPDFYEVEPNFEVLEDCIEGLTGYLV